MEIILNKDIENLGFKDDIVTVKNGFGRNYLIAQGFAILATQSAKKNLNETLKQRARKEEKLIGDAKLLAESLASISLKITSKVGSSDKLFGSINNGDLAQELIKKGHEIDKKFIKIPGNSIKKAGAHVAKIRLHREVIVDFPFEIVPEEKIKK